MARKKQKRKIAQQATLLVVGEGPCDRAFVNHMKALYDSRDNGQKVTVQSADGGSPRTMIDNTVKKYAHVDYTRRLMLLDSDIEIARVDREKANRAGIEIIESTPLCLEGMLLEVLGQSVGYIHLRNVKVSCILSYQVKLQIRAVTVLYLISLFLI